MSGGGKKEIALGANVILQGVVIGTTRFQNGANTYLVRLQRKGRNYEDWFSADDFLLESNEDGAGI